MRLEWVRYDVQYVMYCMYGGRNTKKLTNKSILFLFYFCNIKIMYTCTCSDEQWHMMMVVMMVDNKWWVIKAVIGFTNHPLRREFRYYFGRKKKTKKNSIILLAVPTAVYLCIILRSNTIRTINEKTNHICFTSSSNFPALTSCLIIP